MAMGFYVMRAFVQQRQAPSTNADVVKRLSWLETKTESQELSHDAFSRNTQGLHRKAKQEGHVTAR